MPAAEQQRRTRPSALVLAAGSVIAMAAAGLMAAGLAASDSEPVGGHGTGHAMAPNGSMVHGGVTYYAGPIPDAIPAEVLAAAEPTAITIPSIGVGSELLDLGLQADGSAEVPADYALAGWYRDGGRPGLVGPTVVLGHVDSTDGPAVFYRLRDLTPGEVVEVTTAGGTVAAYSVDLVEQVSKDEFPTFEVFGATRDDVLRLVTCAGEFDRGERSYTDNLVVHASRIR